MPTNAGEILPEEITPEICGRIALVRKDAHLNKSEFAGKLQVSPAWITKIEKNDNLPGTSLVELIALKFNINLNWLLTGEGDMKDSGSVVEYETPDELLGISAQDVTIPWEFFAAERSRPTGKEPEHFVSVNVYPINLLRDFSAPDNGEPIQVLFMMSAAMAEAGPIGFKVSGDSMAPTISNNAIIGLQYKDTRPQEGEVYIIRTSAGDILLRRIFITPTGYLLKADNQQFTDMTATKKSIQILGRVAWVIQTF